MELQAHQNSQGGRCVFTIVIPKRKSDEIREIPRVSRSISAVQRVLRTERRSVIVSLNSTGILTNVNVTWKRESSPWCRSTQISSKNQQTRVGQGDWFQRTLENK